MVAFIVLFKPHTLALLEKPEPQCHELFKSHVLKLQVELTWHTGYLRVRYEKRWNILYANKQKYLPCCSAPGSDIPTLDDRPLKCDTVKRGWFSNKRATQVTAT